MYQGRTKKYLLLGNGLLLTFNFYFEGLKYNKSLILPDICFSALFYNREEAVKASIFLLPIQLSGYKTRLSTYKKWIQAWFIFKSHPFQSHRWGISIDILFTLVFSNRLVKKCNKSILYRWRTVCYCYSVGWLLYVQACIVVTAKRHEHRPWWQ